MKTRKKILFPIILFLGIYFFLEGSSWIFIKFYLVPKKKTRFIFKDKIEERIDHFASGNSKSKFDPVLGWKMKLQDEKSYEDWGYHIDKKGARLNCKYEHKKTISTYGNSFTFCNQVSDDETWQYYLSEMTKSNVINFGIGGYGTDQAFLRLKKEFKKNKTNIVILGILSENLARNINRYRALYMIGGWGPTKPMFFSKIDGTYILLKNPIKKKEDLYKLNSDEFVNEICTDYDYWFPFYSSIPKFKFSFFFSLVKSVFIKNERHTYREIFNNDRAIETTKYIVRRFVEFSEQNKFHPVIVLFPTYLDLKNYYSNKTHSYERLRDTLNNLENLIIIDVLEVFRNKLALRTIKMEHLYIEKMHISPQGNFIIAETIYRVLNEKKILN